MRAVISGTGMHIPEMRVDNDTMAKLMDTSDEWIKVRTGIEQRHYAAPDEATSDLATPAARKAIADAGLEPSDIDYLVVATMTPDYFFPGSAPFIQRKLGLDEIPCLDIRQQCAGFVYALQIADALIRSGQSRRVLVIGAEAHASLVPWSDESWSVASGRLEGPVSDDEFDRNTMTRDRVVLFGDGAGAVVVEASEDDARGVIDCLLHTNGDQAERLWTKAGGSAFRPYFHPDMFHSGDYVPVVEGRKVYALAVTFMPKVTLEILEKNGLTIDDLDLVIMHQANLRINEGVQKRLELPDEKVFNNIQKYGNTTAATIPIAYHEALEEGRARPGDLICFVGLGSGLNWGAILYRC
jgi:3-oxoacyl-[acyl-carrier-protein] synthase-3